MNALLEGLNEAELKQMSLGLAHSVSRYKLKFSADKVDVMIIQAVSLLEDLDKELNNYAMRLKEWYSWHFPELEKIVSDNVTYSKLVQAIGRKTSLREIGLIEIVPEDIEEDIKKAAELSMGTDILDNDEAKIKDLARQVEEISAYRGTLAEYLKNRMEAIAPNLTILVGELVAAKLISQAGSLINLAKLPASTIQILGAEKALFRAMKTKKPTPKYGLIYNASIVGSAQQKFKGRVSRSLAAKCALCVRRDALGDESKGEDGEKYKTYMEARLGALESEFVKGVQKGGANKKFGTYSG